MHVHFLSCMKTAVAQQTFCTHATNRRQRVDTACKHICLPKSSSKLRMNTTKRKAGRDTACKHISFSCMKSQLHSKHLNVHNKEKAEGQAACTHISFMHKTKVSQQTRVCLDTTVAARQNTKQKKARKTACNRWVHTLAPQGKQRYDHGSKLAFWSPNVQKLTL